MGITAYYEADIQSFCSTNDDEILGALARGHQFALEEAQRSAWLEQIRILKSSLAGRDEDRLYLEFHIPRVGKRADAVLLSRNVVFILEFKVGATQHLSSGLDQVEDYALDLKNFHEGSHSVSIVPILLSTHAPSVPGQVIAFAPDRTALPLRANENDLRGIIDHVCSEVTSAEINVAEWERKGYRPSPTIIEAAEVLYRTHSVADITRKDAGAKNLRDTTASVAEVIDDARTRGFKAICFITGVPGSGKTLAGLDISMRRSDEHPEEHAVLLSGNGPLVAVLREALTRDRATRTGETKAKASREVGSFIQNIHHFRDYYLKAAEIPSEKVVIFDEAQRAWDREQASSFMRRKHGLNDFGRSEPEFLLQVMNRHTDWCVVVCLIGGGQEINTGEAGISGWIEALRDHFPHWQAFVSPRISLPEYGSSAAMEEFLQKEQVHPDERLHLAVSVRSFRAETLSTFVGHLIDNQPAAAAQVFSAIRATYPIVLTRDLAAARAWLSERARGTERTGLVASSGALRLRPDGIHMKAKVDPPCWFLNPKEDVRSSSHLEEVASEFDIQGLELDWTGVCWDGNYYYDGKKWCFQDFLGTKWQNVRSDSRRLFQQNAYRVLLTRARQGMVIFVPEGSADDRTRSPHLYDGTFDFLQSCGIPCLPDSS